MAIEQRVLIAGAGPVGLTAAANLVRGGVPVTGFEGGPDLSDESGASTPLPPAHAPHAPPARGGGAADRARIDRAAVPVPDEAARGAGAVRFRRHRRHHRPSLPGAMRAVQTDAHPLRKAPWRPEFRAAIRQPDP